MVPLGAASHGKWLPVFRSPGVARARGCPPPGPSERTKRWDIGALVNASRDDADGDGLSVHYSADDEGVVAESTVGFREEA